MDFEGLLFHFHSAYIDLEWMLWKTFLAYYVSNPYPGHVKTDATWLYNVAWVLHFVQPVFSDSQIEYLKEVSNCRSLMNYSKTEWASGLVGSYSVTTWQLSTFVTREET